MNQNGVAVKKRAQIANANRNMFIWVAVSSVVVGFSVVAGIFLAQRLIYNEKVLIKKNETISTLESNARTIEELKVEIRKLDANESLLSARAKDTDQAIQVILDALPSVRNSFALGASLQTKLIEASDGIYMESLQIEETNESTADDSTAVAAPVSGGNVEEMPFSFTVTGSPESLARLLENLERSIRTINVKTVLIEGMSEGEQRMSVTASAFYLPAKQLEFVEMPVE